MALLDSLLGTDANGNAASVGVNVTIAPSSLIQLFAVGSALIVVGTIGAVIFSLFKSKP